MDITATSSVISTLSSSLLADYLRPKWYAAYTCANHEKRIQEQLKERSIESFLPLYESMRRWKDRSKRLKIPLFPGYIFVRIQLKERLNVLGIPSVVRLVGFNGQPSVLLDHEIETLRNISAHRLNSEPYPYLAVGRRVRVTRGPLEGTQGIVIRKKGQLRLVLSIDLIQRSVIFELDSASVESVR